MLKEFKKKEEIANTYGDLHNQNYSSKYFIGWDEATIDNNVYALDKNKAQYDADGDTIENIYLKKVYINLQTNYQIILKFIGL